MQCGAIFDLNYGLTSKAMVFVDSKHHIVLEMLVMLVLQNFNVFKPNWIYSRRVKPHDNKQYENISILVRENSSYLFKIIDAHHCRIVQM